MRILDRMREAGGFEQVIALSEPDTGLRGFMVLHDARHVAGPAGGRDPSVLFCGLTLPFATYYNPSLPTE